MQIERNQFHDQNTNKHFAKTYALSLSRSGIDLLID